MKIKPVGPVSEMVPDVPEHCSRCGTPLRGMAVDHPDGWLCAIDCGRPRDVSIPGQPQEGRADHIPFSQTGLDAPS